MNQISECCDTPLLYHIWEKSDKSMGYEPWDLCPACLEPCSGYDPEQVDKINHITEGANNDTIARALKRLSKDCGFGRKDNVVHSQNDSIRDGRLQAASQCEP